MKNIRDNGRTSAQDKEHIPDDPSLTIGLKTSRDASDVEKNVVVLFWIRGKRAEDSEVVVVVRSRRLKVKIKELFDLERNGVSTRERKTVGMRRA